MASSMNELHRAFEEFSTLEEQIATQKDRVDSWNYRLQKFGPDSEYTTRVEKILAKNVARLEQLECQLRDHATPRIAAAVKHIRGQNKQMAAQSTAGRALDTETASKAVIIDNMWANKTEKSIQQAQGFLQTQQPQSLGKPQRTKRGQKIGCVNLEEVSNNPLPSDPLARNARDPEKHEQLLKTLQQVASHHRGAILNTKLEEATDAEQQALKLDTVESQTASIEATTPGVIKKEVTTKEVEVVAGFSAKGSVLEVTTGKVGQAPAVGGTFDNEEWDDLDLGLPTITPADLEIHDEADNEFVVVGVSQAGLPSRTNKLAANGRRIGWSSWSALW